MKAPSKQTNPDQPIGGRYKIIGELGAGGFGQTFLAEDLHLPDHPRCVVKQLKPQVSDAETMQTARRLFDIEARVLYRLGDHDQIPRLLAHFEENEEFYLAQELIDGHPLTEEIKVGQRWSESKVIAFLQDLLQVLAFVHEQNVIHRDLKPSNLIRRIRDDRIVLIDFGAVKQVSTQVVHPQTGQTKTISIGTQGYTPKEQLGGNPRFSSDVYAAGIIAIQALTGLHPRHLPEDPNTGEINWREHAPNISAELVEFLDCMVRYDFRARFPTAAEALVALRNLSTSNTQYGLLSESFPDDSRTLPIPQRQSPLHTAASTDVHSGQAPTQHWTPTTSSAHAQPPVTNAGSTVNFAPSQDSHYSSTNTVPTVVAPGESKKKPVIVWASLAVLAAVGGTFLLTKTFLSPQFANQTVDPSKVPASSSNASPGEQSASPTVASSPTSSPSGSSGETPGETAASPTVASSPSVNSVTAPSEAPASPASASSPGTTQASPAPAASSPPTKAAPASAPPASQPAASPAAPQTAELVKQADRAREAGQYPRAIELYDQAIAANPKLAEAHWGRCYSLNMQQQFDDGIAACNKALAINPNYPEALWSKGAALEQQQNPMAALKHYKQATDAKPNFAEAWNNQGVVLLKLNRPNDALDALDRATKLKPNLANAWANRGAALWQLRRPKEAIASIEKAVQINPDDEDVRNLRQQILEQLRR
jgi:serine/threonine protein kinase/Tfp pilus assembly protein PilF